MFISEAWLYTILGIAAAIAVALLLVLTAPDEAEAPQVIPPGGPQEAAVAEPSPEDLAPAVRPEAVEATEPSSGQAIGTEGPRGHAVDGVVYEGEYRNMLDADGFQVYWMNDSSLLHVGLVSPGTGYLAIGFDPDRRMKGANFILGAVNGIAVSMRDDYGIGSTTHAADTSQGGSHDILEAAGREVGGRTTFEFVIPLDSGDPQDKPLEPGLTYRILVAYHMMNDSFGAVHSRRGSGEIRLDPVL